MKIDSTALVLLFQAVTFIVLVGGGFAAFGAFRERLDNLVKAFQLHAEDDKAQFQRLNDRVERSDNATAERFEDVRRENESKFDGARRLAHEYHGRAQEAIGSLATKVEGLKAALGNKQS